MSRSMRSTVVAAVVAACFFAPAAVQGCDFSCQQDRAQRQWDRDRQREADHRRELRAAQERDEARRRQEAREQQRRIDAMTRHERQYGRELEKSNRRW